GLKSCVLKRVAAYPEVIFERRRFSEEAWTHDVEMLLVLADLKSARDADSALKNARRQNWLRVKDWTEISRYQQKSQAQAQRLYDAVTDSNDGVMQWVRLHW
ncbi:MAG TPA: hypothetical protein VGP68_22250, partial [Gemmataceae bacterium]|nr:hypothetical protein [Gemmataceae bacterium]